MPSNEFSKSSSEERKRYTITIERETNDNFVKFEVRPNNMGKKQLINCTMASLLACWMIWGTGAIFMRFGVYHVAARTVAFIFICAMLKNPTIEQVSVFKNYGVQISKFSGYSVLPNFLNNLLFSPNDMFIPRDTIADIIINEGFVRECQVIFYLAIIVKGEDKLTLMFSRSRPRLEDQKKIYNLTRNCLFLKTESEIIHL